MRPDQSNCRGLLPALLAVFMVTTAAADEPGLSYGVFPYLPTERLEQVHAPIAARLGEVTGHHVHLRSRPDADRFREQVSQQTYDIIFVQPFDYVRAAADNGYQPLVCWSVADSPDASCELRAIVVTRRDSDVRQLDQLRGLRLGVPHPEAAVALLIRHALAEQGLADSVMLVPTGNHHNCMKQVVIRKVDACATAGPPAALFEQENGLQLRTLYTSDPIPSTMIAVHDRVSPAVRDAIRTELLSWQRSDTEQSALLHKGSWGSLRPVTDADYDPVRRIWQEFNGPLH